MVRGPGGVKLENANSSIATVTGLQVGTYEFTLTVKDERNLQSQSSVNVIVKEGMSSHEQSGLRQVISEQFSKTCVQRHNKSKEWVKNNVDSTKMALLKSGV